MPLAQVRFLKFSSLVLPLIVLFAGCSSPKAAAVTAAKPVPVVEATGRPNPVHPDPGGQSDPYIAVVRAGMMSGYPQATIGQAFETAFSGAHWSSQQPKGGLRVVTFTGLLPPNMRRECFAAKAGSAVSPCTQDAKVTFEWTFPSDGQLFHLSHVDPEPWPETHRSTREMLLFIYG
jgi:hypothetical protein